MSKKNEKVEAPELVEASKKVEAPELVWVAKKDNTIGYLGEVIKIKKGEKFDEKRFAGFTEIAKNKFFELQK